MRTQLLTYLTAQLTASIKTSQELPFQEGTNALYLKNLRKVYLDEPYTEQDALYMTLSASHAVNQKTTIVRGFLAVDAKNRNADLDAALTMISGSKDIATITGFYRKEFDYTTSISNDVLLYEFQWRFFNIA
jgi:hypothetical protein